MNIEKINKTFFENRRHSNLDHFLSPSSREETLTINIDDLFNFDNQINIEDKMEFSPINLDGSTF